MRVATVPVGYADGLNRRLGNGGGFMMVRGVRCPIVGNVCMEWRSEAAAPPLH